MASTWFDSLTNPRSASGFGFMIEGEENAATPHFPPLLKNSYGH
jgi:hypothetical protein